METGPDTPRAERGYCTSENPPGFFKTVTVGFFCLLLFSCAAPGAMAPPAPAAKAPAAPPSPGDKAIADHPSAPLGDLPASVEATLLPPLLTAGSTPGDAARQGDDETAEPLIDVVVDKTPAKVFFMGLAEGSELNVIVHPEVSGDITMKLFHATIPEAIETACRMYDYDCQNSELGYFIRPARMQTRQYHVNYLRLRRDGMTRTQISSGKTATTAESGGAAGTYETSGSVLVTSQGFHFWGEFTYSLCGMLGMGFSGPEAGAATATAEAPALPTDGAAAATPVPAPASGSAQGMLSWNPQSKDAVVLGCAEKNSPNGANSGRRVVITPQSGSVLVRAFPGELAEVETFLDRQKETLERQVVLEAKIIEVELNEGFQSGVNWSLVMPHRNNARSSMNVGGGGDLFGNAAENPMFSDNASAGFSPAGVGNALAQNLFGGAFATALNLSDFTALIELLETQGKVKVLSSPRVATLNNQKAVIRVGQDEIFVTDIIPANSSSSGSTTSENKSTPKFSTFFSGIALDVTPQISNELDVMLHIHPTVSEVTTDQKQVTIDGTIQTYPLALNRVREADSMVRAGNGEIVVIGGMMKNVTISREAGTPVLKDIPMLGGMFSHKQEVSKKPSWSSCCGPGSSSPQTD